MQNFDVIIVGGGHAGIEASLASSRIGLATALITLDRQAIGRMSCNPAIGGLAKGHLVREIDALGGEMALAADATGIQFKTLNKSKGRAVWSPRAQIDKKAYERFVQNSVFTEKTLAVIEDEVTSLIVEGGTVRGVVLGSGTRVGALSVILTCGTFLNGLIHIGRRKIRAGRMGEEASHGITEFLVSLGFLAGRLKTGTPPRLKKDTIDWSKLTVIKGDENPRPFSFRTQSFSPIDDPCFIAKTNEKTHDIIRDSLHESPMYCGEITGIGPRYCPSIEDKVVRFSSKPSHQIFLEPEWLGSKQIYTNGFSTSLPEEVQLRSLRSIEGLEIVEFVRPGYAIEYDYFPPSQLRASLETKDVHGLFFAGQINGTSGYEEAAAQGLMAGINAARYVKGEESITLSRDQAYIGVLIDDLVTKDTLEPYRMFTSRAEYRLMLRHANADRRLSKIGYTSGLLSKKAYEVACEKIETIDSIVENLKSTHISSEQVSLFLKGIGEKEVGEGTTISKLLKRPNVTLQALIHSSLVPLPQNLNNYLSTHDILEEVETIIKYEGYIERQLRQVAFLEKNESIMIPSNMNFYTIGALSNEAREKLSFVRPETLGQASRISGVTPADISVLSVLLSS